jgi:hypothetical protein
MAMQYCNFKEGTTFSLINFFLKMYLKINIDKVTGIVYKNYTAILKNSYIMARF